MRSLRWFLLLAVVSLSLLLAPDTAQPVAEVILQAASYAAVAGPNGVRSVHEIVVPLILQGYPLVPGSAWTTTIVVQNASDVEAALVLEYRDPAGILVFSLGDSLAPRGSRRYDQASLTALGQPFVGSLTISSDQLLAVAVYAYEAAWPGDGLASFTPFGTGSTVLYVPRVFNDFFGWTSRLAVANWGGSVAHVSVEFFSHDGHLLATQDDRLAPHGSAVYDPGSIAGLPGGLDGTSMAVINSDQPLEGAVIHLNSTSASANGVSLAGNPEGSIPFPSLVKSHSDYSATSGYALWNPGTNTATVTTAYYDTAGRGMVARPSSILPGWQSAIFLGTESSLPGGFIGSAVVNSNEPLVAEVSTVLSLSGASMAYSATSRPAATLHVPSLRRSAAAYTVLTVQNASSQVVSVTVSYYDQAGTPVARQSDRLPPFTAHVYNQSQMPELGEDFWGSAVVSGDQVLAAVVQEYRLAGGDGLTPTPTATSTPETTPTAGPDDRRILLPFVVKAWPPIPERPVLYDIAIGECNDNDFGGGSDDKRYIYPH